MKKLIINIPHSSLKIPRMYYKKALLTKEDINKENLFLCDLYTDKFINNKNCYIVKFKYSRMFCDVEKFKDDSKEIMSKIGMGVIYTKDSNGNKIINVDSEYKNKIINTYYDKYHSKMDTLITRILKKEENCYIIDLHSFSDLQAKKTLNLTNCPDICIGIDDDFKDDIINKKIIDFFKENGYSVQINYPYEGSFVPNIVYKNKFNNVKSIMIEINKRIYLNKDYTIKEKQFNQLKDNINKIINIIIETITKNTI